MMCVRGKAQQNILEAAEGEGEREVCKEREKREEHNVDLLKPT